MKKCIRKQLAVILSLVMVLSAFGPVFATITTMDYDKHWAKKEIEASIELGLAKGYPDGSFKPDKVITRVEFFSLVNNLFEYTEISKIEYKDVSAYSWYAPVIAKANAAGYISGYTDGGIHPEGNITRQEAALIISRIKKLTTKAEKLSYTDATLVAEWSENAVIAVFESGIMSGYPDNTFRPDMNLTRAEAVVILRNAVVIDDGLATGGDTVFDKAGVYGSSLETEWDLCAKYVKAKICKMIRTVRAGPMVPLV